MHYWPTSHLVNNASIVQNIKCLIVTHNTGREIVPNTGANVTEFSTLATKSWKLVAELETRMLHHTWPKDLVSAEDLQTKINLPKTLLFSLFPKSSQCMYVQRKSIGD